MISHLKGTILYHDLKSVTLDVGGVGYKIYTNAGSLGGESGKQAEFWTYLAVRETALDLYGFKTKEELDFFELLITVSGIGPKSALGILSIASISNLQHAISSGDISHLTKVSGIGKKSAEKIVLELKDKLESILPGSVHSISGDIDALEALQALGYGEREAREALKKAHGENTEQKVRAALKNLNS